MDRRNFLGTGAKVAGGLALAGVSAPLLAACGSSSSATSASTTVATTAASTATTAASTATTAAAASGALRKVSYQLSWIKNFQFAGEYIADNKGYFRDAGLSVDLLGGGPNTTVDPLIIATKALVGNGSPDTAATDNAKGAGLKVIGAQYQKSPFCIISQTKDPIKTPQDMKGKKIGIQTANQVLWTAFLKLNKIDPSSFTQVPVQFDVSVLSSGSVDGFFGYSNDDAINLKSRGVDVEYFLLADYGYKIMASTYVCLASSLTDTQKRADIVSFMHADIRGWQDAVASPALAAQLTVDVYGKSLGLVESEQQASALATNQLMVTDLTNEHGLFWMTEQTINDTIASLASSGITATPDMFTTEILAEVYQGKNKV